MIGLLLLIPHLAVLIIIGIFIFKYILKRPHVAFVGLPFVILHFILFPFNIPELETAHTVSFWVLISCILREYYKYCKSRIFRKES